MLKSCQLSTLSQKSDPVYFDTLDGAFRNAVVEVKDQALDSRLAASKSHADNLPRESCKRWHHLASCEPPVIDCVLVALCVIGACHRRRSMFSGLLEGRGSPLRALGSCLLRSRLRLAPILMLAMGESGGEWTASSSAVASDGASCRGSVAITGSSSSCSTSHPRGGSSSRSSAPSSPSFLASPASLVTSRRERLYMSLRAT